MGPKVHFFRHKICTHPPNPLKFRCWCRHGPYGGGWGCKAQVSSFSDMGMGSESRAAHPAQLIIGAPLPLGVGMRLSGRESLDLLLMVTQFDDYLSFAWLQTRLMSKVFR